MKWQYRYSVGWIKKGLFLVVGSALFPLGFILFLEPHQINMGGVTGIAMILNSLLGYGSIAFWILLINIPLFLLGFNRVGKTFFWGSLFSMLLSNLFLILFENLPVPVAEPLLSVICGSVLIGVGLGLVFAADASSGGTDMVARLIRPAFPSIPIGRILSVVDISVVILNGIVFDDVSSILYSAIGLYICSLTVDGVVYGLDYSVVALIVSDHYEEIGKAITQNLDRGITILDGKGYYSGQRKQVLLSAIKKRQVPELKQLVAEIDSEAFVILQDAHQILGEGFKRYNRNEL